jgi:hypothetical protein
MKEERLTFTVHTVHLLDEVLNNPGTHMLRMPLIIFRGILADVAQRAIELNDPKLNQLMCRLTLYEQADPESPLYRPELRNWLTKSDPT